MHLYSRLPLLVVVVAGVAAEVAAVGVAAEVTAAGVAAAVLVKVAVAIGGRGRGRSDHSSVFVAEVQGGYELFFQEDDDAGDAVADADVEVEDEATPLDFSPLM